MSGHRGKRGGGNRGSRGRRGEPAASPAVAVPVRRINAMLQGFGANTRQDRGAGQSYAASAINPYFFNNYIQRNQEYLRMFNTSWEVQKMITIPVDDALKNRAELKGLDEADAKLIWKRYDALRLDQQNRRAFIQERLFGGCVQFGVFKRDPEETVASPLRLEGIRHGDFEAVNVIDPTRLSVAGRNDHPFSPDYDLSPNYRVAGHPVEKSRLIVFDGQCVIGKSTRNILEGGRYNPLGFGESKLSPLYDILRFCTGTQEGAYHLINLASVLLVEAENLRTMSASSGRAREALEEIIEQVSIYRGAVLEGKAVKVSQHSATFGSVPELLMMYMQILSAASDIPATRFLGQAPGGLNATGESDTQNYHDNIRSFQQQRLKPVQERQIDWIGGDIWGWPAWKLKRRDLELTYPPLWSETAKEKADRIAIYAGMVNAMYAGGMIDGEAAIKELKAREVFATDLEAADFLDAGPGLEDGPLDPENPLRELEGMPGGKGELGGRLLRDPGAGFKRGTSMNAGDFPEDEHPRDGEGKFTDKGDGEKAGGDEDKSSPADNKGKVDEERRAEIQAKFDKSTPAKITGDEIEFFSQGKTIQEIRNAMPDWAKSHGIVGILENDDKGWDDIIVSKKGIKNSMEHGPAEEKIKAVAALPQFIKNGIYLDSESAHNAKQIGMTSHFFAAKLEIGKKSLNVGYIIKEDMNGRRFYDHELEEIENLDGLSPNFGAAPTKTGGRRPDARQGMIMSVFHKYLHVKPKD